MRHRNVVLIVFIILFLMACAPSQSSLQTAIAETIEAYTPTTTKTPRPTETLRPTFTPTQVFTKTPTITVTPFPGTFANPIPLGTTIDRSFLDYSMSATILEAYQGEKANSIAQSTLDWITYKKPSDEQEYLAIKVHIDQPDGNPNEEYTIYANWSFTVRFKDGGIDTWSMDIYNIFDKGYPPLGGEGWVFWLVRKGSAPLVYFHPNLIISEQFGLRTSGAYLSLGQP